MIDNKICKECNQVHHLPSYDNICQYCQHGKPENEMTESNGHVTQCLDCKGKAKACV